jgi:hypothetical protein
MSYRIKKAAEVAGWPARLRDTGPDIAGLADEAMMALREQRASLGPTLVNDFRTRYERDQGSA